MIYHCPPSFVLCISFNLQLYEKPSCPGFNNTYCHLQLCKIDSEGKARKVVGCSCVVVKVTNRSLTLTLGIIPLKMAICNVWLFIFISQDYGEESEGLNIVQDYVKSH